MNLLLGPSIYTISNFLVRIPELCTLVFLHTLQVYLKSVFLVFLAPVIFHLEIAGRENLPKFPRPLLNPRLFNLETEPLDWVWFLFKPRLDWL